MTEEEWKVKADSCPWQDSYTTYVKKGSLAGNKIIHTNCSMRFQTDNYDDKSCSPNNCPFYLFAQEV